MGCGQESGSGRGGGDRVERKRPQRRLAPATELGKELGDAIRASRFAHIKGCGSDSGMAQKEAGELEARVSGDTNDGDLARISHFTRASIFFCKDSRVFLLGVMIRTVSSPAMVPAISGNLEASTAAARG